MRRIKLIVAYDGTNYCGWQFQQNGKSIEGELNRCLSELFLERIAVIGASRTDAGVHALCNIAVFDTSARMPADKIAYAVNQRLPEDIRVQRSEEADPQFHPRHCESIKTYEYRIYRAKFPLPTRRLYTHFTYADLNVLSMREAAAYLTGEHDFKSFCAAGSQAETTVRTVYSVEVREEGSEIVIQVSGGGFLYNMVRIIAGTLMEAGKGAFPPEHIRDILKARDRSAAGPTAPAKGLTLVSYEFPS